MLLIAASLLLILALALGVLALVASVAVVADWHQQVVSIDELLDLSTDDERFRRRRRR